MCDLTTLGSDPAVSSLTNLYKEAWLSKDSNFFKKKAYTLAIEIGKEVPVFKTIINFLEKENTTLKMHQIYNALQYLDERISVLEEIDKSNTINYLLGNTQLMEELFNYATTSLNPHKYKYWSNYIIYLGKASQPLHLDSIELFNKLIHELIEIDYRMLSNLYTQQYIKSSFPQAELDPFGMGYGYKASYFFLIHL